MDNLVEKLTEMSLVIILRKEHYQCLEKPCIAVYGTGPKNIYLYLCDIRKYVGLLLSRDNWTVDHIKKVSATCNKVTRHCFKNGANTVWEKCWKNKCNITLVFSFYLQFSIPQWFDVATESHCNGKIVIYANKLSPAVCTYTCVQLLTLLDGDTSFSSLFHPIGHCLAYTTFVRVPFHIFALRKKRKNRDNRRNSLKLYNLYTCLGVGIGVRSALYAHYVSHPSYV